MRFAASSLACLLAILAGSAARPEDASIALKALLDAARDKSGAPFRYHLRGRAEETIGSRALVIVADSEGERSFVRRCAGELCSGLFLDGARLYETNFNETALPSRRADDPRRVTLRAIESYAFTDPDFVRSGGSVRLRTAAMRDGARLERIAVVAPHGAPVDALLDPSTDLVVGAAAPGLDVAFRDQRRVGDSVTLPFEIAVAPDRERFTDRAIVPTPFETPRGLVPQIDGGSTTLAMPRGTRATAPIVQCEIAAVLVPCLIDSGNSAMAMSLELAERLGIEPVPHSFEVQGLGSYVTGVVKAPALKVGAATYPPAFYAVLHDMHSYGYDIVLGADVFAHTCVTLNYSDRTVTFAASAPVPGPNGDGIPLSFSGFLPFASVRLGELDASLVVDTGDDSTVNLAYDYYQLHPSLFSPTSTAAVGGIGGSSDELIGQIPSLQIGKFSLARQRIGATKSLPATAAGHVGSGLLAHFAATFDYANARLDLTPRAGDETVKEAAAR